MSTQSIASDAVSSFQDWVVRFDDEEESTACLSDYIFAWVTSGEGVRACYGDFQIYLVSVVTIIDAWHEGNISLDWSKSGVGKIERSVTKILARDHLDGLEDILDPDWFTKWTFKTLRQKP